MKSIICKITCTVMVLVLLSAVFVSPVSAALNCGCGKTPLIIINGIGQVPLVMDAGTEDEKQVYPVQSGTSDSGATTSATRTAAYIAGFARLIMENELDKNKNYVCYCQVGLRGYLAERILKQNGFHAANLSGGWITWKMYNPDKSKFQKDQMQKIPLINTSTKRNSLTAATRRFTIFQLGNMKPF